MADQAHAQCRLLVDRYAGDNLDTVGALNNILIMVMRNSVSLQDFIAMLQDYLTNPDDDVRKRGTLLLSEVLARLPDLKMNDGHVHFLVDFLSQRLQDSPCVEEVLLGLKAMCKNYSIPEEDAINAARLLLGEVQCQAHPQAVRANVFDIIKSLLTKRGAEVSKAMGVDFVFGFIQAMDGEKDPRNLVTVLDLAPLVGKHFPNLGQCAEELFEVISCYFPITFTPPPNDPYGITQEGLKTALRGALAASEHFAEVAVPFFLEKASAVNQNAAAEALETLAYCVEKKYRSAGLESTAEDIVKAIHHAVTHWSEEEPIEKALSAFTKLVGAYVPGSTAMEKTITCLLETYCARLDAPESMLAKSACGILMAASRGSMFVCTNILAKAMAVLDSRFKQSADQPVQRASCVSIAADLARAACDSADTLQANGLTLSEHPLVPHTQTLFEMFYMSIVDEVSEPRYKCSGIEALASMLLLPNPAVINRTGRINIIDVITRVLVDSAAAADVRSQAAKSLTQLAGHPLVSPVSVTPPEGAPEGSVSPTSDVEEVTMNQLFGHLEESLAAHKSETYSFMLDAIAKISTGERRLVRGAVNRLSEIALSRGMISIAQNKPMSPVETSSVLDCLSRVLSIAASNKWAVWEDNSDFHLAKRILAWVAVVPVADVPLDAGALKSASKVLRDMLLGVSTLSQACVLKLLGQVFLEGNMSALGVTSSPYTSASPNDMCQLFAGAVNAISADTLKHFQDNDMKASLVKFLSSTVLTSANVETSASSAKALAAMMNKLPAAEVKELFVHSGLGAYIDTPESCVISSTGDVRLLVWVTKGLALRCHPLGSKLSAAMRTCMVRCNDVVREDLARGFGIVLEEDVALSKETGASVNVLFKQKFVTENLTVLLAEHKKHMQDNKELSGNYLMALAGMMEFLTKPILMMHMDALLPVALQSINIDDAKTQESSLRTLELVLQESPSSLASHVQGLTPRVLVLATESKSMRSRHAALECLDPLADMPHSVIYPVRENVIRVLGKALDDKKRAVRKAAVVVRNKWMMLGSS